jgi:hypothetical protein
VCPKGGAGQQVTVEQIGGLDTATNPDGNKIQFGSDNYTADLYSSGGLMVLLIMTMLNQTVDFRKKGNRLMVKADLAIISRLLF